MGLPTTKVCISTSGCHVQVVIFSGQVCIVFFDLKKKSLWVCPTHQALTDKIKNIVANYYLTGRFQRVVLNCEMIRKHWLLILFVLVVLVLRCYDDKHDKSMHHYYLQQCRNHCSGTGPDHCDVCRNLCVAVTLQYVTSCPWNNAA